ncbi:MAG TPA: helix-turn-helix domain-containing protein [Candidatus Paceibacterota bacterium]
MESQKTLTNIGLSETESRVYLASLELGESLHSALAKKAGIKRATLYYDVLPKLIEKGLITEAIKGKRKYLVAQDLQIFLETKKVQLEEVERLVPQLRSLLATANSKPTLLLYEGIEGIKKVWFDHLVQKQPILEFVGIEDIHPELQKYLKEHYIWERAKRKISVKMLISGPTVAGIFKIKSDSYELREVRNIDDSLFPIPLSCDVYGDNVSFTLHRKDSEPIGLIIRSREIATMMRSVFAVVWQQAGE